MTGSEPRTSEQIRAEIQAERAQLDAQLAALGAEAKRSGRIAGSLLAALSGVLLLARLRSRHRAR
jgi:hypothetical protein